METIEIDGYKVNVVFDNGADNPFESWDSEPPILVFDGGRHGTITSYGSPDRIREFVELIPDEFFSRGRRWGMIKQFISASAREFAENSKDWGYNCRRTFTSMLADEHESSPSSWSRASDWFDLIERLMKFAGIPCLSTQKNDHNQGDSVLILVTLTDEWKKKIGWVISEKTADEDAIMGNDIMEGAANLYASWAFGDVYGIMGIIDPDGDEVEDSSVWGFYGSDHEKSGLLDSARETIAAHKANPPERDSYCGC